MNELQVDIQNAVGVLMQFMVRLLPLALTKKLPDAEWQSFSRASSMVQARVTELQGYVEASQSGNLPDPKGALTSVFAFKASLDELHSSLDKLLVLTGASEQDRQLVREVLIEKFAKHLRQEENRFNQAFAALSDKENPS